MTIRFILIGSLSHPFLAAQCILHTYLHNVPSSSASRFEANALWDVRGVRYLGEEARKTNLGTADTKSEDEHFKSRRHGRWKRNSHYPHCIHLDHKLSQTDCYDTHTPSPGC